MLQYLKDKQDQREASKGDDEPTIYMSLCNTNNGIIIDDISSNYLCIDFFRPKPENTIINDIQCFEGTNITIYADHFYKSITEWIKEAEEWYQEHLQKKQKKYKKNMIKSKC